jgi:hypothetical protein
MKPKASALLFAALVVIQVDACSGGASNPRTSGGAGAGGSTTGSAGATAVGTAGATGGAGASGAVGVTGTAGVTGAAGAAGSGGTAGAAGSTSTTMDASVDTGAGRDAFPSTTIVKMMVIGSSNEIGTCWRAFLWKELQTNGIKNFDFVGQQKGGPDCGVGTFDSDLQAMSGIIITDIPASTYAAWFKANTPDIILMHFGGADLLSGKPIAGVMKAYSTALEQARLANPHVILLIAQHTPEGKDTVLELNADIATWAVQNSTPVSPVVAVDLYTGILASDLSDGVHLNAAGSQKVADRWYAALTPFLKP